MRHRGLPNPEPALTRTQGNDELVQRLDKRTGRMVGQFETVWRPVELQGVGWQARHAPEAPDMQLYASWKYPRCAPCGQSCMGPTL